MYRDQHPRQYDRGHLVPSRTYSSSQKRHDSTYAYTNAVPQYGTWNGGAWSRFEARIRRYAEDTCTKRLGTLYLLTGTSFARIKRQLNGNIRGIHGVRVNRLQDIDVPNSLWTAGCCVLQNGNSESFAVMGNNVPTGNQASLTLQITVAQLQTILAADVFDRNVGGLNVVLFPGDPNCANNNMANLPPPPAGR